MLKLDIAESATDKGTLDAKIGKPVKFNIDDRFDPMLPITRKKDDLRFLSLERTREKLGVRLIDFAHDDPKAADVHLVMNGQDVNLHSSWALRPVLVLETRATDAKSKLVFSRGEISRQPHAPTTPETKFESESMKLETLVFQRDADKPDMPFEKAEGAACVVTYEFQTPPELRHFPCYHRFDPTRTMRASPAARMQASQLLVGQIAGPGGYGVAFSEFCLSDPLILKAGDGTFTPLAKKVGVDADKTRTVTCEPLNSNGYVGEPIYRNPNEMTLAENWPSPMAQTFSSLSP
jgi:hypothetical protein